MPRVVQPGTYSLDAVVVLGCRVAEGDALPSGAAARRIAVAARAWLDGLAPLVLASGGRRWAGVAEADAFGRGLAKLGVDAAAIQRELSSLSTLENAWYSARVLNARCVRTVGLVTCDWHIPRAVRCFRSMCFEVVPLPAETPGRRWRLIKHLRETGAWWFDKRAARAWYEI